MKEALVAGGMVERSCGAYPPWMHPARIELLRRDGPPPALPTPEVEAIVRRALEEVHAPSRGLSQLDQALERWSDLEDQVRAHETHRRQ